LLSDRPEAAIDATGLETPQASHYYLSRSGRLRRRKDWPKLTVVCHNRTHLLAGAVATRGPSNDSPQFPEALRQACRNVSFDWLLADAGYDAEHNHALCRRELGIRSTLIPAAGSAADNTRDADHEQRYVSGLDNARDLCYYTSDCTERSWLGAACGSV
jgi:hypothetical protein